MKCCFIGHRDIVGIEKEIYAQSKNRKIINLYRLQSNSQT